MSVNISLEKKQRVLDKIPAEEFRSRFIRPLFIRLGYEDARKISRTNGADKAMLFFEEMKLKKRLRFVAVEGVAGNVNTTPKSSAKLEQLIDEVKELRKQPISVAGRRKPSYCNEIFLCASGGINDKAREAITERTGDTGIIFVDGKSIINYVDNYCPEIWEGLSEDVFLYHDAIRKRVEGSIDRRLFGLKANDKQYVPLDIYRLSIKAGKVRRGEIKETPHTEKLEVGDILEKSGDCRLVVLSDAGMGKTTLLWRIAYEAATRKRKQAFKPLVLEAKDIANLANESSQGLLERCKKEARKLTGQAVGIIKEEDLQKGSFMLLVDALDEIANQTKRQQVLRVLDNFSQQYPKTKIVCASRFATWYDLESEYKKRTVPYLIAPLSWEKAREIILNVQKNGPFIHFTASTILDQINSDYGIDLSPLLVAVFASIMEYANEDIPANLAGLFEKYSEMMLGKWDGVKALEQQYEASLKFFLLKRIAFEMHKKRRVRISEKSFNNQLVKLMTERGYEINIKRIKKQLNESELLRIGGGKVSFSHLLLQEFFAGIGITGKLDDYWGDEWWVRPLMFYFGDKPESVELLEKENLPFFGLGKDKERLVSDGDKNSSKSDGDKKNPAVGFLAMGLALQSCYLSLKNQRVGIWKQLVEGLAKLGEGIKNCESSFPVSDVMRYYRLESSAVPLGLFRKDEEIRQDVYQWLKGSQDKESSQGDSPQSNGYAGKSPKANSQFDEARLSWYLIALIQMNLLEEAYNLIKEKGSWAEPRYAVVALIEAMIMREFRPIDQSDREWADKIVSLLEGKIPAKVFQQFNQEQAKRIEKLT